MQIPTRILGLVACLSLSLAGCQSRSSSEAASSHTSSSPSAAASFVALQGVHSDGSWIRDADGGVVLLSGMNVAQASKSAPYLSWQTAADYDVLRENGFNFVRLLLQWKAVEPSPGVIDPTYLDAIEQRLDWCHAQGLGVVLDMHQDAYGESVGGNGAPDWATFDDGWQSLQLPAGLPWQTIYLQPRVIAAFESFWQNHTVSASGLGVQEHYAATWAAIAQRLGGHPAVLGYDVMNEPFYGQAILPLMWAAVQQLSGVLLSGLASGQLNNTLAQHLADPSSLATFLDSLEAANGDFERTHLQPFLERCCQAIRAVDTDNLVLVEPTGLVGIGVRSALEPLQSAAGTPLEGVVFAPHYYDPIAELLPYDGEVERARQGLARARETAQRMGVPMLLGEWGFLRASLPGHDEIARDQLALCEEFLLGQAYWDYHPQLTSEPYWPDLVRARVQRVAGTPTALSYDPTSRILELSFNEDGAVGPTRISLPNSLYPNGFTVDSSDAAGSWSWQAAPDGPWIDIHSDAQSAAHTIEIRPM